MKDMLRVLKRAVTNLTLTKAERRHARVGPAELWGMKRDFQIRFLKTMDLMPEHCLLDIGCGTLRGGVPIIDYLQEGRYYGVEAREEVLNEGKRELCDSLLEGKKPNLLFSEDMSKLVVTQKFDYIWAFSVLMHMSNDVLGKTLRFVSDHMSTGGVFYANVNIGEREEGGWQGFPVVARSFEFYSHLCSEHGLVVSDIGSLEEHGHISNVLSQDCQRMLRISR